MPPLTTFNYRLAWVGADDRNRTGMGLHPTDFRTTSAFAAAQGVRGLDYPFAVLRWSRRVGAARLVSTPSPNLPLKAGGLARDRHFTGFPEFEQFCILSFPRSTQSFA